MQKGNFLNVFLARFPGGKGGRCVRQTTLPPSCAVILKSGNPTFLEPSGPLQACNGTALPLPFILSSTCFGYIRPSSGALDVELQHMVFCTEFWMGGGLESRCVGRVYGADGAVHGTAPSAPAQKTICCNSTSNAPDDGRMYPKHVELRIHQ